MGNSGKVLIAAPVHRVLTDGLNALGYSCDTHETISQQGAYNLIKDCVGVITSTRLQLDKDLIDAAPELRWIGRMGSGMEVIDTAYAKHKDIACFGSPEGNANAVGEHATGMLLAVIRRIALGHAEVKNGIWRREENRGTELEGKTIGIIGCGNTGSAFAKKLQGFDMTVLGYDKYAPDTVAAHIVKCESLQRIYEEADIISFHVPIQPDTIHYFNNGFIAQMNKPFILVNTSRGVVADTRALYNGIMEGKVLGACLDVLEQEPIAAMDTEKQKLLEQMMAMPNVVVTPHIAGYTFEALYKMSKVLLDKIISHHR